MDQHLKFQWHKTVTKSSNNQIPSVRHGVRYVVFLRPVEKRPQALMQKGLRKEYEQ